ncbi:unnamed protein product [Orchesella dallaii]|uniref:Uncharacterized protein n=1 Tax=Orchesella dallaii TaxID=48710 RepID=A0ABP1RVA9_9HEXA
MKLELESQPIYMNLSTFSSDTSGQLDIFGHDGDTLGVNCTQVGVLKKTNQVSFRGFLQSHNSRALETQVGLEILSDFSNKPLEGQLADEELSALLVTTDFSEGDGTRAITMGLLDTSGGWGTLTSCLRRKLLTRSFSSRGFTGSLLGTSHFVK